MTTHGYDTHCGDLAELFLEDEARVRFDTEDERKAFVARHEPKLAQHIQDAIEGYMGYDASPEHDKK